MMAAHDDIDDVARHPRKNDHHKRARRREEQRQERQPRIPPQIGEYARYGLPLHEWRGVTGMETEPSPAWAARTAIFGGYIIS